MNLVAPVRRVRTYITIPAIDNEHVWDGYSKIVGQFNVACPNNISLLAIASAIPTAPNFVLCVSYVNADHTLVRYRLWEGVGEIFYAQFPLYTGQLIKKNFTLEFWNVDSNPLVSGPIQFITSVLGNVDNRNHTDYELVAIPVDSFCTGQENTNLDIPVIALPFTWGECAQPVLNS